MCLCPRMRPVPFQNRTSVSVSRRWLHVSRRWFHVDLSVDVPVQVSS